MKQALLIIDVQATFKPPAWLLAGLERLTPHFLSLATVIVHDEASTPFQRELAWTPAAADCSLLTTDHQFIKHGYTLPPAVIAFLQELALERVLVAGIQTDTCCLAAGFALFDAGLRPTLITDLTLGSSLDRSGQLGISLWKHHFRHVTSSAELLATLQP